MLLQLSETVASHLSSQLASLAQLFLTALGDSERSVSVMALRACCAFVSTLSTDDDALLFRALVPPMVQVARVAAAQRDDSTMSSFCDAFAELAQTPVPVINTHLAEVVPFLLEVMRCSDEELERATRDGAANVIGALAEYKPKLLGKAGLVPLIVETCVGIMATADASRSTGGAAGALFVSATTSVQPQYQNSVDV